MGARTFRSGLSRAANGRPRRAKTSIYPWVPTSGEPANTDAARTRSAPGEPGARLGSSTNAVTAGSALSPGSGASDGWLCRFTNRSYSPLAIDSDTPYIEAMTRAVGSHIRRLSPVESLSHSPNSHRSYSNSAILTVGMARFAGRSIPIVRVYGFGMAVLPVD